jgi:hypothetical protein
MVWTFERVASNSHQPDSVWNNVSGFPDLHRSYVECPRDYTVSPHGCIISSDSGQIAATVIGCFLFWILTFTSVNLVFIATM